MKTENVGFFFLSLMCSVKGREMAWKFVQENWDELHNRYEGGFLLSRLIKVG